MQKIVIDPKMFINKPFTQCPKCHGHNFGVLCVYGHSYTKRCADCRYDESFSLPVLNRKVIYLDQFVISEMMKAINSAVCKMDKVNPFYLELFKKLDRLNKLQLIVCPDSPTHDEESRISKNYQDLKRMFEQLSHGTSFYPPEIVKRFQVHNSFRKWIGKETRTLDIFDFIHDGNGIDGWDSRLIISINSTMSDEDIQNIRKEKTDLSGALKEVVDSWKSRKSSFSESYEREINIFGPSILKRYVIDLINYEKGMRAPGDTDPLLLSSILSETSVLMTSIHEDLKEQDFKDEEIPVKTSEYFTSELIKEVPYAKISSILYASLATEYSNGRVQYPTPGFFNDVGIIAAYAPYCDAMFLDKECRRLLVNKQATSIYDLSNKVFSLDNKEEFLAYLDDIEKSMTKKHLDLVHKVYGESWPEPFLEMYD